MARAVPPTGSGSQGFHELLQRLASAHHSEVEEVRALRRENAILRAALGPRGTVPTTTNTTLPGSSTGRSTVGVHDLAASSSNQGDDVVHCYSSEDEGDRASELVGDREHHATSEQECTLQAHWLKAEHPKDPHTLTWSVISHVEMSAMSRAESAEPDSEDMESHKGSNNWFPQYPNSQSRILWDGVAAMLVFYDVVMLPLVVFKFQRNDFMISMDWIALIFWTINMPASLCVGYVAHEQLVMDMRRILLHYLKTWFILDVLILLPDWTFIIVSGGGQYEDSAGLSHAGLLGVLRLGRMARLVRLLKLRRFFESVYYRIESEYVSILIHIVQMISLVLIFCHVIGCMWFYVGDTQDGKPTWMNVHGYDEEDWWYQYALAFHWSITQFTPSTNDIAPKNMTERVTAICVVVFALVGFTYIVGSITGSLAHLRSLSEGSAKMFWDLRRYLTHFRVRPTLALRIEKYLEHAWARQQKGVHPKSVQALAMLSEPLRQELDLEIYRPSLTVHPLLLSLGEASPLTMRRIAHSAIRESKAARHDLIFVPREPGVNMFFRVSGTLWYRANGDVQDTMVSQAEEGWVAEPVLWVSAWDHKGVLTAASDSDLLMVDPVQFGRVVTHRSGRSYEMAVQYASAFVQWLMVHAQGEDSTSTGEVLRPADLASHGFEQIGWMQQAKLSWSNNLRLGRTSAILGLRGRFASI
ncbi:unnamed protein product [Prorocentrum cordatum]|uniref:Ion transport domain-containing protein n=1 Tax=Prorocentrum cordatum TaxID=2364126 RepID=A0ABN9PR06_9DINO|nr:unnamed protein product [Polarella glacialis]